LKLRNYLLLTGAIFALGHGVTAAFPLPDPVEPPTAELQAPPKPETIEKWTLIGGSHVELRLVNALQERGIKDKNAIATILGNVKQESKFHPNICEGGYRVQYHHCSSGGYGLIQWTSSHRYMGLGNHAWRMGINPSTADAQISYLFTEREWKDIEKYMQTEGNSIHYYMNKAYYWLGWGVHGNRTVYAHNYASRLKIVEVPA